MEDKIIIELLKRMKRIRFVEDTIAQEYAKQEMRCPTHLCTGQEAISAAVCLSLESDDFAVSTHRAHGHYLAKGGDLNAMIAEIYGKVTGCSRGKGGSMHLVDISAGFMGSTAIVGGSIPVGVGLGLSIALKGKDRISCVFMGDGATEEGVFYESVNFAVMKNLPVLFICENNLYSVYTPLGKRQPEGRKIAKMVEAIGVESISGDGNDAIAVYQKVNQAVKEMRISRRPRFFEFYTYRWREHCGPNFDNHIGYRSEAEFQYWKKKDPCVLLEKQILKDHVMTPSEIRDMEQKIIHEVKEAFRFAKLSPFPDQEMAYKGLFKEKGSSHDTVSQLFKSN